MYNVMHAATLCDGDYIPRDDRRLLLMPELSAHHKQKQIYYIVLLRCMYKINPQIAYTHEMSRIKKEDCI